MSRVALVLVSLLLLLGLCGRVFEAEAQSPALDTVRQYLPDDLREEEPTVVVALLVRNKAHVLPQFLSYFENLDYPKQRMALWIRCDHSDDASEEVLQQWIDHTASLYHSVDVKFDNRTQRYQNESSPYDWPRARFDHLIRLKEAALVYAHRIWAHYIFFLDVDILLTEPKGLAYLTSLHLPIVAPMLFSEGLYSNFWCGMTPDYYYQRTDEYKEIYNANKKGIFKVPMIHSAVLVHLNYMGSHYLTFDRDHLIEQQQNNVNWSTNLGQQCRLYDGPVDDVIVFAISANCSQIPLFVTNELQFGYILTPMESGDSTVQEVEQLVNIKSYIVNDLGAVRPVPGYLANYTTPVEKHKLTLDRIYMINLDRRPERRRKMENLFEVLGLEVEHFPAVDGKKLNQDIIKGLGITFLPGYEDPYHHRQMTMGEVGCFLSHYYIWQEIVDKGLKEVLILEDDIRAEPYFRERAESVLEQARNAVEYDLIYFGRKRLKEEQEPWVAGTKNLVHVGYSYWTLGYVISLKGARKLLAAKPLEKLLPVDEYLPVMFNRHPNKTWAAAYPQRDLIAFSAAPLLLYPTHYTGDEGYISDTEDSEVTGHYLNSKDRYTTARAQLKSDRELEFEMDKLETATLDLMESDLQGATTKDNHHEL